MASGCVLSNPPEYGTVKQTPPFLQLDGADPSIYFVSKIDPGAQSISIQVRSEDAGEELTARLYLDYDPSSLGPDGGLPVLNEVGSRRLPPSTLDTIRTISVQWTAQTAGCHQVTMVVTHTPNLDFDTNQPIDTTDVAYATWWFNVDDQTGEHKVDDCAPKKTVPN